MVTKAIIYLIQTEAKYAKNFIKNLLLAGMLLVLPGLICSKME